MNTSLSPRLVPFWAALGALAITAGCTAVPPAPLAANPVNPTPDQVDVSNDALTVLAAELPVEAYLDPGAGSMLLQVLLGGTAAAGVLVKVFWHSFTMPFRRRQSDDNKSSS